MKKLKYVSLFEDSNKISYQNSKIIYTIIPYFSNGVDINVNDVKSFTDWKKAQEYTWTLHYGFEVVENELI